MMVLDVGAARVLEITATQQALKNPLASLSPAAGIATPPAVSSTAAGRIFAGAVVNALGSFPSAPKAAAGGTGPRSSVSGSIVNNRRLGPTTNPVPGATGERLDQGFDGTARRFVAPFNGKVVYSQASDSGWGGGGYVAIKSARDPKTVYYAAEGLTPTVHVGQKVSVGHLIARPRPNPYNGTPGNFEIGRANPAIPNQPLAQVVANPRKMVLGFYNWTRSLGGPAATSTAGAGSS